MDLTTTWSQFQIVQPASLSNSDWDPLQVELFARTYRVLPAIAHDRSWHLKFTSSRRDGQETIDFLRVDATGSEADVLGASLSVILPWELHLEEWQPLVNYRVSASGFSPAQVVLDLELAHVWSIGWARYMAEEGITAKNVQKLHPHIFAFLRLGELPQFREALLAENFPDAGAFANAVHARMVTMDFFDYPDAPQGTVPLTRRHLRANTVFCTSGCPGFG